MLRYLIISQRGQGKAKVEEVIKDKKIWDK